MRELLEMHILHGHEKQNNDGLQLARAYVISQPLESLYSPEEGLLMGTAFPNLSNPYKGWRRMPEC